MAVTLTPPPTDHERVYVSYPIEKFTRTEDGDLIVYGKATDGTIDSDEQIVDPGWSAGAIEKWLNTGGNVRVQHNPQLYPAGRGLSVEIDRDGDDGHWLKALVVEPTAKTLVEKKVLTAFSVGIARPVIRRDVTGKARGGIVTGGAETEIAEISLVDRPANRNCGITLVKSEGVNGAWTYGDLAALLAKVEAEEAEEVALLTKSAVEAGEDNTDDQPADGDGDDAAQTAEEGQDFAVDEPGDDAEDDDEPDEDRRAYKTARAQWVACEPVPDLSKAGPGTAMLVKQAARDAWRTWSAEGEQLGLDGTEDGYALWLEKRNFDPGVGGGVDRDQLPASDFVDPAGRRFPIHSPKDVQDAAGLQGNAKPAVPNFQARLTAIAHRKGPAFVAQLPAAWGQTRDEPDTTKNITLTSPDPDGLVPYNLQGAGDTPPRRRKRIRPAAVDEMVEPDLTKATTVCPDCGADCSAGKKRCPSCGMKLPKAMRKAMRPDLVKRPSYPGQRYKHGWIPIHGGARPSVHGHVAEHHRAMSRGKFEEAGGHLLRGEIEAARPDPATHHGAPRAGNDDELAGRIRTHRAELMQGAPKPKGRMGPKQRQFHEHMAEHHEHAAAGRHDEAAASMHAAMQLHPDTPKPRKAAKPKAEPKPVKATAPGVDEFGGRKRPAWMAESRRAQSEGMPAPKRGAPAHELARAVGLHDTERALRGPGSQFVRFDLSAEGQEREIQSVLARFRAGHDEQVRMLGLPDSRGLTRDDHDSILDQADRLITGHGVEHDQAIDRASAMVAEAHGRDAGLRRMGEQATASRLADQRARRRGQEQALGISPHATPEEVHAAVTQPGGRKKSVATLERELADLQGRLGLARDKRTGRIASSQESKLRGQIGDKRREISTARRGDQAEAQQNIEGLVGRAQARSAAAAAPGGPVDLDEAMDRAGVAKPDHNYTNVTAMSAIGQARERLRAGTPPAEVAAWLRRQATSLTSDEDDQRAKVALDPESLRERLKSGKKLLRDTARALADRRAASAVAQGRTPAAKSMTEHLATTTVHNADTGNPITLEEAGRRMHGDAEYERRTAGRNARGRRTTKGAGAEMTKSGKRRLLPPDTQPAPRHREPDGPQVEALEHDAGMRSTPDTLKSYGAQRMHDALCPAYSWPAVADHYPALKSLSDAVDPAWFDVALIKASAAGDATGVVYADTMRANATALGHLDPAMVADARADLTKMFNNANGGGTHTISPAQFQRPYIGAGHAPLSAATGRTPLIPPAVHVPDPDDFHRGLITAGHQAEPPGDRGDNLDTGGSLKSGSARTWYPNASRAAATASMAALHDHISATLPGMCPMAPSRPVMPPDMGASNRPTPTQVTMPGAAPMVVAGLTKSEVRKMITKAVGRATADQERRIAELTAEIEELGAQPDPAQAPVRGAVTVNKAATLNDDATPVERISLVEKAQRQAAAEQAEMVRYLQRQANESPHSGQRLQAEQVLAQLVGAGTAETP